MIIFGDKTVALFDLWSLEHFCTGCNIAVMAIALSKKYFQNLEQKFQITFQVMSVLLIEFLWEIFEHYLEAGISYPAITDWFQGVEYIWNRAITDPLITLSGLFLIRKFPRSKIFPTIFSIAWLYVNIFVYSDCMGLQRDLAAMIHNF